MTATLPAPLLPWHRGMFALDIVSFGGHKDPGDQLYLRATLYRIVEDACAEVGISWDDCYHEDRGDGFFALTPPDVSIEHVLNPLAAAVAAGVAEHNEQASPTLRLRMAVDAGYVYFDRFGVTGSAVTHLFRLLDNPAFKAELDATASDFALVTSERLFHDLSLRPATFRPILIKLKETLETAYLRLSHRM